MYRFAGRPRSLKRYGADYARACWLDVVRTAGAAAGADTEALTATYRVLGIILAVETIWAVSYTIWPKRRTAPVSSEA